MVRRLMRRHRVNIMQISCNRLNVAKYFDKSSTLLGISSVFKRAVGAREGKGGARGVAKWQLQNVLQFVWQGAYKISCGSLTAAS